MIYIKNEIEQNYNIKINKIYSNRKEKYFFIGDKKIYIKKIEKEKKIDNLMQIANDLYNQKKHSETFLINKHGNYTIEYKNKKIALLICHGAENIELSLNDILSGIVEVKGIDIEEYDIRSEWKKRIDNFELKIMEYNKEFSIIMKYINYYIGMAENAIQLLEKTEKNESNTVYLGHSILENEYSYRNYVDPLTYVKTLKMYDIANYFKYKFYINGIDYNELEELKYIIKDEQDKRTFLAIIMYPSEVFDRFEKIISLQIDEKTIYSYINKIEKMEEFISYIQEDVIKSEYIKWLKEK